MITPYNNSGILVSHSEATLSEPQLLTETEKYKLLVEWNNTQSDYPQDKCIHELFEATAELKSEAEAVVFGEERLTYRELNAKANQLAHYLQTLGVKPEVLVGICVERSLDMLIGLLAILKAGGAYVPLDPAYPQERLAYMLEDSSVSILLTQSQLLESFPQPQGSFICLDTDWKTITLFPQENPTSQVTSDNLAYIIYTSGSTGKPKGVAIEHHSPVALFSWAKDIFTKEDLAGVLASTSICFDLSVFELFLPLSVGGKVILAENALSLPTLPAVQEITLINTVPSAIAELVRSSSIPSSVRTVNLAGEPLQNQLVQQIYQQETIQRVFNLYGPSEDTTYSTFALVKKGDSIVTIGRPISNTQVYLLDEHLQPVPIGVPGELYIGGEGLARGYLNRPDLTQERFVPNPFNNSKYSSGTHIAYKMHCGNACSVKKSKLYKTGDLARYLSDGNIDCLGRIDHQVKIRGFRIELGEIEAALTQHPEVFSVVVVAREDIPGNKRLVAYLVPKVDTAPPNVGELRSFLKAKLPDYMVPAAFVFLSTMPLTLNGKIDRRALPEPDTSLRSQQADFVPASTPIEEAIVLIWSEVFGFEVGVHDNFVELGGHSLLAIQIISKIWERLEVKLPVNNLFKSPTIADLAKIIESVQKPLHLDKVSSKVPPLVSVARNKTIPLSFCQQQFWVLAQLYPEAPVYNESLTIYLGGDINTKVLEQSLTEMIRRHEILRTTFDVVDGEPVQVIHPPSQFNLNLSVIDLRSQLETEREAQTLWFATEQLTQPMDLSSGQLLRATLIIIGDADYRLYIAVHHILIDGISINNIFTPELQAIYTAFSQGKPSPLSELPVQYADFAAWQQKWFTEESFDNHLLYWEKKLANPPILKLPTFMTRSPQTTFKGSRQYLVLSENLTQQLKFLSRQEGVTLFVTLAAVINTLLYRYSSQSDICIGTVMSERNRPEFQDVIGAFLNTLVLRTDLSGNPSFRELLKLVRQVTLEAYEHRDLPFKKLVAVLNPERNLKQNPFFSVAFILQPPLTEEKLGWTASQQEIHSQTSKFDLTFSLQERESCITGHIEYSTELFDDDTIERIHKHFIKLLEAVVINPDRHIGELPLLTESERHQLLVEWNNTETEYPQNLCIHQLFEVQAQLQPDAIALVFEKEQITYGELNRRANQFAHYLQSLEVAPEVLVGICVERSCKMIVAILGILKAGGAYVPLDTQWPSERIQWILSSLNSPCIITEANQLQKFQDMQSQLPNLKNIICLDTVTVYSHQISNLSTSVTSENTAYIIHTSGSTGVPKGVVVRHKPAINLIDWVNKTWKVNSSDRLLFTTSLCFDLSVYDIFGILASGGSIRIASKSELQDPKLLVNILCNGFITFWNSAPPVLQQLVQFFPVSANRNSKLRLVFLSGDWIPLMLPDAVRNTFPNAEVISLGGATEATVWSNYYPIKKVDPQWKSIPYGKPIQNAKYYILDAESNPCPIGVCGELYIGGNCLASGYTDMMKTAERFISNPFASELGERLYRTGDLARYMSDGNIEFLGRIDNQVKIRGYRVELGEIEAALLQHSDVQDVIVVVREDVPGDKRLVAYVVPKTA
jgi:surfactin family lipopeptide synthetase A